MDVSRPELESVRAAIVAGEGPVHIAGEPGIGKTTVVDELVSRYDPDEYVRIDCAEFFDVNLLQTRLYRHLRELLGVTDSLRHASDLISGVTITAMGFGVGVDTVEPDERVLQLLWDAVDRLDPNRRVVIVIDDLHKVGERRATADLLVNLDERLGSNHHIVTAGQMLWPTDGATTVELGPLPEAETVSWLEETFPMAVRSECKRLYEQLDGHPYLLTLAIDGSDGETVPVPVTGEIRSYLVDRYLEAGLCSAILTDWSLTEVRRTLRSIGTSKVVRRTDPPFTTNRCYVVHDQLQSMLTDQMDDPKPVHERAYFYHVDMLSEFVVASDGQLFETAWIYDDPGLHRPYEYSLHHLGKIDELTDGAKIDGPQTVIEQTIAQYTDSDIEFETKKAIYDRFQMQALKDFFSSRSIDAYRDRFGIDETTARRLIAGIYKPSWYRHNGGIESLWALVETSEVPGVRKLAIAGVSRYASQCENVVPRWEGRLLELVRDDEEPWEVRGAAARACRHATRPVRQSVSAYRKTLPTEHPLEEYMEGIEYDQDAGVD